jgi:hypothetical protein
MMGECKHASADGRSGLAPWHLNYAKTVAKSFHLCPCPPPWSSNTWASCHAVILRRASPTGLSCSSSLAARRDAGCFCISIHTLPCRLEVYLARYKLYFNDFKPIRTSEDSNWSLTYEHFTLNMAEAAAVLGVVSSYRLPRRPQR